MTINPALYASDRQDWETPAELFAALDAEFHFDLDPCATPQNAKCERYFTEQDDGLSMPWYGNVYMNPPYGRNIARWMRKAYDESRRGATVVCLTFSRTDTAWWHEYAAKASEIRFIRGRVRFVGATSSAPFPSAIIIFRPEVGQL